MKKQIKLSIAILLAAVLCLTICSCSEAGKSGTEEDGATTSVSMAQSEADLMTISGIIVRVESATAGLLEDAHGSLYSVRLAKVPGAESLNLALGDKLTIWCGRVAEIYPAVPEDIVRFEHVPVTTEPGMIYAPAPTVKIVIDGKEAAAYKGFLCSSFLQISQYGRAYANADGKLMLVSSRQEEVALAGEAVAMKTSFEVYENGETETHPDKSVKVYDLEGKALLTCQQQELPGALTPGEYLLEVLVTSRHETDPEIYEMDAFFVRVLIG